MMNGADGGTPSRGVEALRDLFEELGLGGYEARVLAALVQVGSAPASQLPKLAGVPRTSVYPVLDELGGKRLAQRLPGDGPAIWASPDREEVINRLEAAQEERLRELHAAQEARLFTAQEERLRELRVAREDSLRDLETRAERARQALLLLPPAGASVSLPYVHLITQASQVRGVYERLLGESEEELLFINRPPYSASSSGSANPGVLDALARGVRVRVLYETGQFENPEMEEFWKESEAYHDAGVEGRMSADLAVKLIVCDRRAALAGMTDPATPDGGYPTLLLIEHPGYAAFAAAAFEQFWAAARPYQRPLPATLARAGAGKSAS